jgi:hypothetical protein
MFFILMFLKTATVEEPIPKSKYIPRFLQAGTRSRKTFIRRAALKPGGAEPLIRSVNLKQSPKKEDSFLG